MSDVLIFHADGRRETKRSVHTPDYEGRADCVFTRHFDASRVAALPARVPHKHLVLDLGAVREMNVTEKAEVAAREQTVADAAAREAAVQAEMRKIAEERLALAR